MSTKKRYLRLKWAGTSAKPKTTGADTRIELKFDARGTGPRGTIVRVELDTWQWRELANAVDQVGQSIAKELKQRADRVLRDTGRILEPPF